MNTLIANQYGQVQGEVGGTGLTLAVSAQTPRRESVEVQTRIGSVEQLLHLLAIMRAVERRIEQFQLHDAKKSDAGEQEGPFDDTICSEGELFSSNGSGSKNKIYGRFAQFLIYEQVDQGRLRVFFAVRDEAKRVARFDLHPGEVQAFHALVKRALLAIEQVDLLLRDELSLSVSLNVSGHGLRFMCRLRSGAHSSLSARPMIWRPWLFLHAEPSIRRRRFRSGLAVTPICSICADAMTDRSSPSSSIRVRSRRSRSRPCKSWSSKSLRSTRCIGHSSL
jgi:hypothetical protein